MGEGKDVCRTYPAGTPTWVRDSTSNDSDKLFTVPANKRWSNVYIYAELNATATVGNRTLLVLIGNGANGVFSTGRGSSITASVQGGQEAFTLMGGYGGTNVKGNLGGGGNLATFRYDHLPPNQLLPGYTIRMFDVAAVDAAADDMTVILYYEELDV